ncbi:hypothetical protein F5146DRAFT_1000288 [Armillaria mellea]|nr:hypothetical protein F5146DRAFT_1000288 [Armillaria mellea]
MSYDIQPVGEAIPSLSTAPIPAGNYGWFFSSKHCLFSVKILNLAVSLADQARQRDQNGCLFIGNHYPARTSVTWIILPYTCHDVFPPSNLREKFVFRREDLVVVPNATLLHDDLIPYFQDNAFSVDIIDNYRIIIFRDIGAGRQLLPTFLPRPRTQDSEFEIELLGGDIREDYPLEAILKMMTNSVFVTKRATKIWISRIHDGRQYLGRPYSRKSWNIDWRRSLRLTMWNPADLGESER